DIAPGSVVKGDELDPLPFIPGQSGRRKDRDVHDEGEQHPAQGGEDIKLPRLSRLWAAAPRLGENRDETGDGKELGRSARRAYSLAERGLVDEARGHAKSEA